jgi:hypothetical protein
MTKAQTDAMSRIASSLEKMIETGSSDGAPPMGYEAMAESLDRLAEAAEGMQTWPDDRMSADGALDQAHVTASSYAAKRRDHVKAIFPDANELDVMALVGQMTLASSIDFL